MTLTRREMLAACAGAVPVLAGSLCSALADDPDERKALGVVIHSYPQRIAADRKRPAKDRIDDPLNFIEHVHALGGQGVQIGLGIRDEYDEASGLKDIENKLHDYGMYREGIVRLPRNKLDLERFRAEVLTAARVGANVVRTVLLSGRRYETFDSAAAFRQFADEAFASLALAKSVITNPSFFLAVENHKDFRADELVAILKRIDSENIGVCLDTGNSIALLEDPMEVVEALAPWAVTTHFKDMGVEEYDQGFRLAEVPLGEGFLDLPRIVRVLRAARPSIHFNLEMITRDPLDVPCLTDKYWATFECVSGRALVRTLKLVRDRASKHPLPRVSQLTPEERVKVEEENVRRSLAYAREKLGL